MKVSSKIISGFFVLMLLALAVLAYQLTVIHQMQSVNHDLSEIDMNSATIVLRLDKTAGLLSEDCKKYFIDLDPGYEHDITLYHQDFLDDLAEFRRTARSGREREATEKLAAALDDYWR